MSPSTHALDLDRYLLKNVDPDCSATTQKTVDECDDRSRSSDIGGSAHHFRRHTDSDVVGCMRVRTQEESLSREFSSSSKSCAQSSLESETSSADSSSSSSAKSVAFADVTVNSHSIVLGDNPSVSCGPPITISWDAFESERFDLDEYEEYKPPARKQAQLHVPRITREDWLRNEGYARSELNAVSNEVRKIQKRRSALAEKELLKMGRNSPYNPTGKSAALVKGTAKKLASVFGSAKRGS